MKNKKKLLIGIGTVAAAGVVIIGIGLAVRRGGKDSVVYRDTAVEYGAARGYEVTASQQ